MMTKTEGQGSHLVALTETEDTNYISFLYGQVVYIGLWLIAKNLSGPVFTRR
ncbi:MAG: hypothetical protein PHU81_08665 [Acidobacteriota bacterium]|nr:hypothetical protein [Acidobacteriota bacterium]